MGIVSPACWTTSTRVRSVAHAGETWLPADPSAAKLAIVSASRARPPQGTYP